MSGTKLPFPCPVCGEDCLWSDDADWMENHAVSWLFSCVKNKCVYGNRKTLELVNRLMVNNGNQHP